MVPRRLRRLEELSWPDGPRVFVARPFRVRLLGLAFLRHLPPDCGLLIPRCSSVHTFGMRFALDVVFLDEHGEVLRVRRHMAPRRVAWVRGASCVVECPAGRDSPGDIMPPHG